MVLNSLGRVQVSGQHVAYRDYTGAQTESVKMVMVWWKKGKIKGWGKGLVRKRRLPLGPHK